MIYVVKKRIGKKDHEFQCEGDSLHDCLMEAARLSFGDVHKCGLCGNDNLDLGARVAKNKYKYSFVKCWSCKAELTFGQQQEDNKTFYLRTREEGGKKVLDWKPFGQGDDNQGQPQRQQGPPQGYHPAPQWNQQQAPQPQQPPQQGPPPQGWNY